jgi:hypothetical protein
MKATVFYVAETGNGRVVICVTDGEVRVVAFSLEKGGPWKSPAPPKRGDQITLEGLVPAGEGLWVPTSAFPLPAEPPKAMIRRAIEIR